LDGSTYAGLIVPRLADVFGIVLLRQYFSTIPTELEDAARIDGCSRIGTFFRIIVPLSRPAFATLAIFSSFRMERLPLAAARHQHR
jgi:multiple sugar transport system permease protein